jgi:hypothetical protein
MINKLLDIQNRVQLSLEAVQALKAGTPNGDNFKVLATLEHTLQQEIKRIGALMERISKKELDIQN